MVKRHATDKKTVMGRDLGTSILHFQDLGCQQEFRRYDKTLCK